MEQTAEPGEKVRVRVLTRRGRRRKLKRVLFAISMIVCGAVVFILSMTLVPRLLSGLADHGGGGSGERVDTPAP